MTDRLIVDASVAYKWVRPIGEDNVPAAEALLDAQLEGDLLLSAPSILFVELSNAVRYSGLEAEDALRLVTEMDSLHVELHEPDGIRLRRATILAFRHRLSMYDALYLALAEEFECPLVTADKRAFGNIDTPVEIRML
jgi:predicted nucleic acid-binding protein